MSGIYIPVNILSSHEKELYRHSMQKKNRYKGLGNILLVAFNLIS